MEDLFHGLNCSLRLAGKIGDSMMMEIISTAMEEAYERILRSREGGLQCLNDKSRFCDLAIMQLDWCLWFLQEEMDSCGSDGDGDGERQDLVGDLQDTRDRIRRRLEETETAIAEKEREMLDTGEIASELRRESKAKDEELRHLRTSLDLDGARRSRSQEGDDGEVAPCDRKSIIIRHLDGLCYELTDGEAHLLDAIHSLGPEDDSGGEFSDGSESGQNSDVETPRNLLRANVEKLFKKLTRGMSILRRHLLLPFEEVDEQKLLQTLERDVFHILVESFQRDINNKDNSKAIAIEEQGQGSEEEFLPTGFISDEGLLLPLRSETMEPQIDQAEPLDDEAFCSVKSKLEKALQQMAMTRIQLKELGSDLGVPLEEKSSPPADDIIIKREEEEEEEETVSIAIENKEDEQGEIHELVSQYLLDLEGTAGAKTQEHMARLERLKRELELVAQQASSLRGAELLYRKAFISRCHDLQTAEAEVDLLGDEVDSLVSLLEKIYLALDYYSPVLQNYQGVVSRRFMRKFCTFQDNQTSSFLFLIS